MIEAKELELEKSRIAASTEYETFLEFVLLPLWENELPDLSIKGRVFLIVLQNNKLIERHEDRLKQHFAALGFYCHIADDAYHSMKFLEIYTEKPTPKSNAVSSPKPRPTFWQALIALIKDYYAQST